MKPRANSRTRRLGDKVRRRSGELAFGREGGHRHDRIVHALGDATGKEVMRAVTADRRPTNVETWQNTFTLDLLTLKGVCRGRWFGIRCMAKRSSGPSRPFSPPAASVNSIAKPRTRRWPPATAGRGLSGRRRAAQHGIHAIPSHGALHRRRSRNLITEAIRGQEPSWSIATATASCRLRSAWGTRSARRGQPVDCRSDGKNAASQCVSRPAAFGSRARANTFSRASPRSAPSSVRHHAD